MPAGQVVNSVTTEITAEVEGLRAKLAVAEAHIGNLEKKTRQSGTAATVQGQKYATAARSIASASETMARMGKVSGETAKQVVSQASSIAFAFGPTGAIVGAIGIATLAIVQLFKRIDEEAEKTKHTIEDLVRRAQQRREREDPVGTAEDRRKQAIAELQAAFRELDRLERGTQSRNREDLRAKPLERARQAAEALTEAMAELGDAQNKVAEQAADAADQEARHLGSVLAAGRATAAERAKAAQLIADINRALADLATKGTSDPQVLADRVRLLDRLEALTKRNAQTEKDAAKSREERLAAANKFLDEARQKERERAQALRGITAAERDAMIKLAEVAGDTLTVLDLQIADITDQIEQAGRKAGRSPEEIARSVATVTAPLRAAREAATAFNGALARIEIPPEVEAKLKTLFQRISKDLDALRAKLTREGASEAEIERAVGARAVELLTQHYREAGFSIEDARQKAQELADTTLGVERAANHVAAAIANIGTALVSVISAMGLLDDKTERVARGLINVGAGIGRIIEGDTAGGVIQTLGGAADLFRGVFGGQSEQAKQRERHHQQSLQALNGILRNTGDLLRTGLTGNEFLALRGGVSDVLERTGTAGAHRRFRHGPLADVDEVGILTAATGMTWEEIKAVAASFGVTLDGTKQSMLDLDKAMAEADFEAFVNSFEGAMARLEARRRIDPAAFEGVEGLERLREVALGPNGPGQVIKDLFAGFDLATEEGRRAAVEALKPFLEEGALTAEMLGDMDPQELFQFIVEFITGLQDLDPALRSASQKFSDALNAYALAVEHGTLTATEAFAKLRDQFRELWPELAAQLGDAAFESEAAFRAAIQPIIDSFAADGIITEAEQAQIDAMFGLADAMDVATAAARQLAGEFGAIDLQAEIFGEAPADTINKKLSELGLGAFDLTSATGRQAAIDALRDLARTTENEEMLRVIAGLIRQIEGLGDLPGQIADAVAGQGGGRTVTSALQTLTIHQGDRLITIGESIHLTLRRIETFLQSLLAPLPALQPPAIPGFGTTALAGGASLVVHIQAVNIPVTGTTASATLVPDDLSERLVDGISTRLAHDVTFQKFLAGNRRVH